MKVALITASFPPDNASAPFPASYELAKALTEAGHEVLVLTLTEGETRRDVHEGVQVYRQKFDILEFPGMHFSVFLALVGCLPQALSLFNGSQKVLEEFQPDVIESQDFNGLGLFFGLERRYPFVVRVYGPLAHLLRSGTGPGDFLPVDVEIVHSLEIAGVGSADGLISLCGDMADQMANWSGVSRKEFTVIPTLITPPATDPYPHIPASSDEPFPRLLYWGRIQQQKGVDLLIEALPAVAARFPNFRLRLSGSEAYNAGAAEPFGNVLRKRLAEMNLTSNVEFVGFLSVDKLREQVGCTDICVFPSRYETACYAAIEAAMYGGCVLATKVGGLPDHIAHGTSGYLVEPESPAALAEGIIKLASDDQLRKHLRDSADADVIARCAPALNARRTTEVYERAINKFKSQAAAPNPTVGKIAEAMMAGLTTTVYGIGREEKQRAEEKRIYDLLCEKYSEGARAGYEEGLADGLKAAKSRNHTTGKSLVHRLAGKVLRITKGTPVE